MNKPTIFISCGQYTNAEKRLGKQIAQMVKNLTGFEAFFAEDVQDLNGLDTNILGALRDCVGFITVLHPRGDIKRPDGSVITRASVWIEQEIAIATYIQRVEKRELPIIAFKHVSVGREGIRDLLHLNPVEFTDESEVLVALAEKLKTWKTLKPVGVAVILRTTKCAPLQGHEIRMLTPMLVNDTNERIERFNAMVEVPASILKHWNGVYELEVPSSDSLKRRFEIDERQYGPVVPRRQRRLIALNYCTACAHEACAQTPGLVASSVVTAKAWIAGREYTVEKTIQELAEEAEREESRAK